MGVQKGIEDVTCPSASLKTTLYLFINFFQAERPFLFLSEKKKRSLFLNHVEPSRSPKPKRLDWSILFFLVKLVLLSASIRLLINRRS